MIMMISIILVIVSVQYRNAQAHISSASASELASVCMSIGNHVLLFLICDYECQDSDDQQTV